jgi:DNA-directed RNA polymerase specialized sigma24 family protein
MEAIQVTIATRVAIGCLRRRRPRTSPIEQVNAAAPEPDDDEMSPEEAQFYVREIMRAVGEDCRRLFDSWLQTLNLRLVAEHIGLSHAAARQRMSRCLGRVRKIAVVNEGPLGQMARAAMTPQ